jgi:hypothetical protein
MIYLETIRVVFEWVILILRGVEDRKIENKYQKELRIQKRRIFLWTRQAPETRRSLECGRCALSVLLSRASSSDSKASHNEQLLSCPFSPNPVKFNPVACCAPW